MEPYDYQKVNAQKALEIFAKYKIVYLAMEQQTGKTLTSLLVVEQYFIEPVKILVITKKACLDGWQDHLNKCCSWLKNKYTITNYHNVNKIKTTNFSCIILDEAHKYISSSPKVGKLWVDIRKFSYELPIIYLSATPHAQGMHMLFHQFALTKYSPWHNFANFYVWYGKYALLNKFGQSASIYINGRIIETYKHVNNERLRPEVDHLFITATRKNLGFAQEPIDKLCYIQLNSVTINAYNLLLNNKLLNFTHNGVAHTIIANSGIKLRTSLHMLEGGVAKIGNNYLILSNTEKIDYILKEFSDNENLAIMYQYIAEGNKLRKHFKNALILQSTTYAEGISLAHIKNLVIYSQDFSTAGHTQRRARQTNKNRSEPIIVHFLLVKKAISEQVYNTVSKNKKNFVDLLFNPIEL